MGGSAGAAAGGVLAVYGRIAGVPWEVVVVVAAKVRVALWVAATTGTVSMMAVQLVVQLPRCCWSRSARAAGCWVGCGGRPGAGRGAAVAAAAVVKMAAAVAGCVPCWSTCAASDSSERRPRQHRGQWGRCSPACRRLR